MNNAFVVRNFLYLIGSGLSSSAAKTKFNSLSSKPLRNKILPSKLLLTAIEDLESISGNSHSFANRMSDHLSDYQTMLKVQRNKWLFRLVYISVLLLFALKVSAISTNFLLPQFSSLFGGSKISEVTAFMLQHSNLLYFGLLLTICISMLAFTLIANHYKKHVQQFRPAQQFMRRFPGFKSLYTETARALALSMYDAFISAGVESSVAIQKVESAFKSDNISINSILFSQTGQGKQIQDAKFLGTLDQELQFQAESSKHALETALNKFQVKMWFFIQFVMAILIAILLLSIYLPLFQLGAII